MEKKEKLPRIVALTESERKEATNIRTRQIGTLRKRQDQLWTLAEHQKAIAPEKARRYNAQAEEITRALQVLETITCGDWWRKHLSTRPETLITAALEMDDATRAELATTKKAA